MPNHARMSWLVLAAIPVLAVFWLRLFGRFVDGESERDHVDAVRLGLLGLALVFLLAHALLLSAAAVGLQLLLAVPRPRLLRRSRRPSGTGSGEPGPSRA